MAIPIAAVIPVITQVIDKIFPDKAKADEAKAALLDAQRRGELDDLEYGQKDEEERTKRQQADMESDSQLAKTIRPLTLIYLLVVIFLLSITDGNLHWGEWEFTIHEEYIELYKALLLMAVGFYFSSRGLEKITALFATWRSKK